MPGRRGKGGGRRRRVMSFLQPCLLVLLEQEDQDHGYNLLNGLNQFGINRGQKDPSLIYRALREMELAGLVISEWDQEGSLGPQRRIYRITPDGSTHLKRWIEDLNRTRNEIDRLIAVYETVKNKKERSQLLSGTEESDVDPEDSRERD